MSRVRGAACLLAVALLPLGLAGPAAAQKQDSTKTRTEIIWERLRTLKPIIVDTSARADSLRADSLRADSLGLRIDSVAGAPRRPPPSALPRDSVMQALAALGGYALTEYRADSARFDADSSKLYLRRNAEVQREGQHIAADSAIIFNQETSIACARGSPTVTGAGGESPLRADSLCYNVDTERGVAFNVKTEITEGASWIVHSQQSFTVGDTLYSHSGMFTDCQLDPPHYHFGAGEIKYINRDLIVARDVTFRFRDVPVFWLPFFVQSTKTGRRSGILMPRFGINDIARQNAGYRRKIENVGFYWAISDHFGAEMSMAWQSANFTQLQGTLDFRFLRQFLAGSVTYGNIWKSEGGREFTLASRSEWQPDERTRIGGDVSYASSTVFIEQRSIDPRELNQNIRSNVGINRRFDWGSLNVSGRRNQSISDGTVTMELPSVGLSLTSITLFPALPGEEKFFSNATWTGSLSSTRQTRSVQPDNPSVFARGQNQLTGNVSSTFTMGRFSLSQGANFSEVTDLARSYAPPLDTLQPLPQRTLRRLTWNTGINYQQRLIGTTTFTPGLSLSGEMIQGDTTGGDRVAAPTRINFNAALRTDLFGFLRFGAGPLEAIRHRISPSISYTYSPAPTITQRQREMFRLSEIREQNRLSIGISQTFEAKPRRSQAQRDSMMRQDTSSGPRRQDRVQPITILSINTDAVVYDFVQAKEDGDGIVTAEIGNNIQSDLLRGLQLSFAHDLFEELRDQNGQPIGRDFKPHLSRVNASFTINADSWFARLIGLGRRRSDDQQQRTATPDTLAADTSIVPQVQPTGAQFGIMGSNRSPGAPNLGQGNWSASFNYSLSRPREGEGVNEQQMLTANLSLQPTAQWSVMWNTGYNFTRGEFTDHMLTLTRQMHDWDAHFDFIKAQNGNFSFQFRVQLRANPDIKLDYEQRELQNRPLR